MRPQLAEAAPGSAVALPLRAAGAAASTACLQLLPAAHTRVPRPPPRHLTAEALTLLTRLESAYLSRNPLEPGSLSRLAPLRTLRLLSLIGCW